MRGPNLDSKSWAVFQSITMILLVVLIGLTIWRESTGEGMNGIEWAGAEKLYDMADTATAIAKADARAAHDASLKTCADTPPSSACRAAAEEASAKAALAALMTGGCIEWETSEWDPSRPTAERVKPKTHDEAQVDCKAQAEAIAERIADWSRGQGG